MGKSTICMAIFNSYVTLPEGTSFTGPPNGKSHRKLEPFWTIIPSLRSLRGLHKHFVLILRQARGMAAIVEGRDETLTSWDLSEHLQEKLQETLLFMFFFSSKYDM